MCGIFGWAGKDPKRFNRNKLNNLGIMNEVRGGHSCGITKDGEVIIGINDQKLFRNFLAGSGYTNPKNFPVVIGHTRHSTFGAHTIENAHPFRFGTNGESYKTIGVHNGTLVGHTDLAKKYKIDLQAEGEPTSLGTKTYRTKIDSEVILQIIAENDNFEVLGKYNGAAALVWTDTTEPNVMYCWHGESRKRDFPNSEVAIERPLFYYQEGKNSVYISSLQSSLFVIGATTKNCFEFDTNTVYKITDGNVATAEKTKINRDTNFQTGVANTRSDYKHPIRESNSRHAVDYNQNEAYSSNWNWSTKKRDKIVRAAHNQAQGIKGNNLNMNIFLESPAENVNFYGTRIYFNKLRHWRNGHRIEGIYTWVDGHGFYYLGQSINHATNRFYDLANKPFYNSDFTSMNQIPEKHRDSAYYPFNHGKDAKEIVDPPLYYFYEGVRIRTQRDYEACISTAKNNGDKFTYEQLSYCAAHPIMDISVSFKSYDSQEILLDGVLVTDVFTTLGAEKIYTFEDGNCTARPIIADNRAEAETESKPTENVDQLKMKLTVENIKQIEEDIVKKETEDAIVIADIEDDLLDDDINDMFKDALQKFPAFIKRLEKYRTGRATTAKSILDKLVKDATKLIAIEIKE